MNLDNDVEREGVFVDRRLEYIAEMSLLYQVAMTKAQMASPEQAPPLIGLCLEAATRKAEVCGVFGLEMEDEL